MFDFNDIDLYSPYVEVEYHQSVVTTDVLLDLPLQPVYDRDCTEWEDLYDV